MSDLLRKILREANIEPKKNSILGKALFSRGVEATEEFQRIRDLPRRTLDFSAVPDLTPLFRHTEICNTPGCDLCRRGPAQLLPMQSALLFEVERMKGAIGALPVGCGKTLCSLLLADVLHCQRAIILVPPDVRDQLLNVDIDRYARHFKIPFGRFTVVAYSQLSSPRTPDILENLDPDGIFPDEAHCLRNRQSTRYKRFRVCVSRRPTIPIVPLSGTLTVKSVKDYSHLSDSALRENSPLPREYKQTEEWASALDVPKADFPQMPPGALLEFCNEEEKRNIAKGEYSENEAARLGFRRRLVQSHGVVATSEASLGVSLIIRKRQIDVPKEVADAIRELTKTWCIEDEEIDSATTMAAYAREMSCGFYYVWDWPEGKKDYEWLEARRDWNRAVRNQLLRASRPGLDSPSLVALATMRGDLPKLQGVWDAWRAVKDRWSPKPPTKAVWLSEYLMHDMVAWSKEADNESGIIWYGYTAVEEWLEKNTSIPVYGSGRAAELVEVSKYAEPGSVIACSLHADRKGKNLQHRWSRNLFSYVMANGEAWEQAIGRTHRTGQTADDVVCDVYLQTEAVEDAWRGARESARYIEDSSPMGPQKLNYATYVGFEAGNDAGRK